MAGVLVSEDIVLAPAPEQADVIIVNTCSFIEAAREESIEAVLSACAQKETGPCRAVLVAGCLPQRYRRDLQESLPEVDAFIGLDELRRVADIVRRLASGEREVLEVSERPTARFEPDFPALVLTGGPYAYLKVADGCDHRCAFCAIPGIRGKHRSRSPDGIVAEAETLLENGFKELDLVSQDVTSYGRDLGDGTDLCTLLRRLAGIGGEFWIRLLYGYPSRVTRELLEVMADQPSVCAYLDLPVQHSHAEILRAMRRADTIRHVSTMAARVRKAMPGATLRTTCLVGFPGETEAHFEHLLQYVQQTEFDHLGAFVFSPEEGTPAFDLPDPPDRNVVSKRRERLMLAQKDIIDRKARALVSSETEVLLEGPADRGQVWVGRSRRQAPEVDGVTFVANVPAGRRAGEFIGVRYTAPSDYDMNAVAL